MKGISCLANQLKILKLGNNKISSTSTHYIYIIVELSNFSQLEELYLEGNLISKIDEIVKLKNVSRILTGR